MREQAMQFQTAVISCVHIGNADCWYLNKLVPLGGLSSSSLLPMKVFPEVSFVPAPTPQGSFKYNQFVKSCSKTSRWNPQADAIIFLWGDWGLLFPCSGTRATLPSGESLEANEALGKFQVLCSSEVKDPGAGGGSGAMGYVKQQIHIESSGILWGNRNGDSSFGESYLIVRLHASCAIYI